MKISGENIKDTILKRNKGCFACPMECGRSTVIKDKKFEGEGEGPEYETVALMGASCGINDLAPVTKANYLCNQLGMDTIDVGNIVACLWSCTKKATCLRKTSALRQILETAKPWLNLPK